jgi:hypothetical protein
MSGEPTIRRGDMSAAGEPTRPVHEAEEAEAAFEVGLAKLEARLRLSHPELFDEAGRLCPDKATRLLVQQTGGEREITGAELLALAGRTDRRRDDAT